MARALASLSAATLALLGCAPSAIAAQLDPNTRIRDAAPALASPEAVVPSPAVTPGSQVVPTSPAIPASEVAVDSVRVAPALPVLVPRPPGEYVLITGGTTAGPTPWQVQLYTTHEYGEADFQENEALPEGDENRGRLRTMPNWERIHRCGGAYIGDMWVLTAAHCVLRNPLQSVLSSRRVRVGTQSLTQGGTTYRIERVIIHKDYRSATKLHDIALIKIVADTSTDVEAGTSLKSIRILGERPDDPALVISDPVSVTGWGLTGARAEDDALRGLDGSPLRSSAVLMEVELTNFPQSRCEAVSGYEGFLGESVLCVGSEVVGRDSCNGDSGGPLTRAVSTTERALVGLVSWGKGCGLPDIPGIYTNVSEYMDWINAAKGAAADQVTRM